MDRLVDDMNALLVTDSTDATATFEYIPEDQ